MTCAVSAAVREGARGGHLRLHRQHRGLRRRLCGARRADGRGDRARGQDRHGQAGPGAHARRARGQLARATSIVRSSSCASSPIAIPIALVNSVNAFRLEGQKTARLRDPRRDRRDRRAVHPGRERRQHDRVLEGVPGGGVRAADARLPGGGRGAAGARRARSRTPRPWRARSGSATRRAGRRRWARSCGSSGGDRRRQRRRDPRRLAPARRRARACSASPLRRPRWPACCATARATPQRVVCVLTGHGLKDPQTALDHAGAVVPCEAELDALERAVLTE